MISIEHLVKRYGRTVAVEDLSLTCEPGTVTGLLGPDGAGKSTTLRVLTGLSRATSGTATIGGRPYRELRNPGRVVGSLLDAAAQHPGRTGRETLLLAAIATGVPTSRVGEMLERVGLDGAGARRVGQYSLGMRQRLGIAQALVGDPHVLVLDEPANGLDPEGVRWLRGLLRDFADRGGTVLLSSHLLGEVRATVDRLVVVGGGRVVVEGTPEDLLRPDGVLVRGLDRDGLVEAMTAAGLRTRLRQDGLVAVEGTAEQVGRAAGAAGQVLLELRDDDARPEDLWVRPTDVPRTAAPASPVRRSPRVRHGVAA
jgi:ABC-2 type transport system ATP-binding protein